MESSSGIYYFGYGAMVNPVARANRNVETVMEKPAILNDYRLTFAYGGAGNILKQRGWSVHGVVMECKNQQDWESLEAFDAGYEWIVVDVYPYGSDVPIQARVFIMQEDEDENAKLPTEKLPQERYIRIIAEGMKFHGVDEEYIDYQIMNVPYIPSRKPADYLKFPYAAAKNGKRHGKLKQISFNEYQNNAVKNMWFLIGNRVIQVGELKHPSSFHKWLKSRLIGGEDSTWMLLQSLYDPCLPVCEVKEDITAAHVAWAENQMVDKFEQADMTASVVFLLKDPATQSLGIPRRLRMCSFSQNASSSTPILLYECTENSNTNESMGSGTNRGIRRRSFFGFKGEKVSRGLESEVLV